jgi:hypothetical protein
VPITENNAAKSTGLSTPVCNARSQGFTDSTFAVVRPEDVNEVAHLHDLAAVYQPVNSRELLALDFTALRRQAMVRAAHIDVALDDTGMPFVPMIAALAGDGRLVLRYRNHSRSEPQPRLGRRFLSHGPAGQRLVAVPALPAQGECLYRRAVEEFDPLEALRPELPNEAIPEVQPKEYKASYAPPGEPIRSHRGSICQKISSDQTHFSAVVLRQARRIVYYR